MMLYVYRISDHEYGASTDFEYAKAQGDIMERWPVNTIEQARFLKLHGCAFAGVSSKVSRIAEALETLMTEDLGFKPIPAQVQVVTRAPAPKLSLWQRIFA